MPNTPLPDFPAFRTRWLKVCSWLLAAIWVLVAIFAGGALAFWAIFGSIFMLILYMMQAATLAGDGAPHVGMPRMHVLGLALGLSFFDTVLIFTWSSTLDMIAVATGWFPVFWVDYVPHVCVAGFAIGVIINTLVGLYLPRFEYLRLILWGHLFGFLLLILPQLVLWLNDLYIADDTIREQIRFSEGFGYVGGILLLVWGIAPMAYLWAFRGYRKRMAAHPSEDDLAALAEMP